MVNLLEKGKGCIKETFMAKFIHINGGLIKFLRNAMEEIQV